MLKKELIKFRMSYLLINVEEYALFDYIFKQEYINDIVNGCENNISDKTRLYEYIRSRVGCYLNSFYYALILYSMYKENPDKILTLVSKVLKHEMTTLKMLEYVNLYGDIRGEMFEKELGKIKKLLK